MQLPANPEFSRPMSPESLAAQGSTVITGAANAAECEALAERFDVPKVLALTFRLEATPFGKDGWRLSGVAEARLEQSCVVTLEPVETLVTEAVDRRFVAARDLPQPEPGSDVELDAEMADGPDGYEKTIDLGEVAAEAIALGIDPYPRREDADTIHMLVGPAGSPPLTDEAARPFAGLAALKQRSNERG
jgi:hypothetical protein